MRASGSMGATRSIMTLGVTESAEAAESAWTTRFVGATRAIIRKGATGDGGDEDHRVDMGDGIDGGDCSVGGNQVLCDVEGTRVNGSDKRYLNDMATGATGLIMKTRGTGATRRL